jgi:hypothetical protein
MSLFFLVLGTTDTAKGGKDNEKNEKGSKGEKKPVGYCWFIVMALMVFHRRRAFSFLWHALK